MTRLRLPLAAALAVAVALAPGLALARVGGGASMGSRGGMTYSAPPSTGTSQFTAPIGRSYTPNTPSPGYGAAAPAYADGGLRGGFGGGSFTSGLLGGLVGAGLGGMLFGHGMFGGIDGGGSILGLLIQFAILFFVGRWLLRLVLGRQPTFAGLGGAAGGGLGGAAGRWSGRAGGPWSVAGRLPAGGAPPPITVTPADYHQFEQLLRAMQASWSSEDLAGLRAIATPEMASYFGEQLARVAQPRPTQPGGRRAAGQG